MCELVHYYRQGMEPAQRSQNLLTVREREIIPLFDDGEPPNTEIADTLFVSEHTIKSHLITSSRSWNVKNRLGKAVSWAKDYLDMIAPT